MIISLRRLAGWAKFLTLFLILTLILYHLTALISQWIHSAPPYSEPKGRAIKVFAPLESAGASSETLEIGERVKLFYWLGE
ncbi:DUF4227 family protein [Paludifilum halophilum]|uniref:DUF4227 domain-containing protein n=1 Tax=Paludifilum halophilum TaxID=1642702 RepID=A0A235BC52_9BACL|nr:DUF4227 family protein [Paludifilum halophilum]OYD09782.1 hypothetical protein CHM34_01960 [Paludifilum halophilum]